ncbi:hypothetical protein [Marinifilum fragile]|uniref:hypothetical protein n=1 Tax=Marinifilum fragile TaxID=570161 RepID=UPI002AA72E5D|nr:hypothetical protein [Marinifilum fragile]
MNIYSEEIKYKKKLSEVMVFPVLLVFACTPLFSDHGYIEVLFGIFGGIFASIYFFPWLNKLMGNKRIMIDSNHLSVVSHLFIDFKCEQYELSKISNPKSMKNEKSETYRASGEVSVLGIKHHPEKLREYDLNPVTVHFDYGKRHIKIGEGMEAFNGKEIISSIKSAKKNRRQ